jgi:hypothetical protein
MKDDVCPDKHQTSATFYNASMPVDHMEQQIKVLKLDKA